jgi:hypothetical protein
VIEIAALLAALAAGPAPAAGPASPPVPQSVQSIASDTWINSRALGAAELRDRVIVLDFWTYG